MNKQSKFRNILCISPEGRAIEQYDLGNTVPARSSYEPGFSTSMLPCVADVLLTVRLMLPCVSGVLGTCYSVLLICSPVVQICPK